MRCKTRFLRAFSVVQKFPTDHDDENLIKIINDKKIQMSNRFDNIIMNIIIYIVN